jgi:tetrapyrrole methylase family protein/MazG family protein
MGVSAAQALEKLLGIIKKLRSPEGCLWDQQQKKSDIGKYLIEEAYEVLDAIESGVAEDLKEELGDLLFQILFLADIAEDLGEFGLKQVIDDVSEKMIRRHPHVFGDKDVRDVEEIKKNWDDIKQSLESKGGKKQSLSAGTPRSMPALLKAQKITEKASKAGFNWIDIGGVLDKVEEEFAELREALNSKNREGAYEELGDLLFSLVNLCRFAGVNSEEALKKSTDKFTSRFSFIEKRLKRCGSSMDDASLEEMDKLWNESKDMWNREK